MATKRKAPKRKAAKSQTAKRKAPKRKAAKSQTAKRKAPRRKAAKKKKNGWPTGFRKFV